MTRKLASVSFALLAFWVQLASAQDAGLTTVTAGSTSVGGSSTATGTIMPRLVEVNGQTWTGGTTAINKYACRKGKITVQLSNLPPSAQYPYLEVWLKTGETDCQNGERRTAVVDTNRCQQIDIGTQNQLVNATYINVEVDLHQGICNGSDTDSQGAKSIFFLAVMSQNSAETTASFGVLPLTVDTLAPMPPTNVKTEPGETQIPLTWTLPAQVSGYYVLVDTNTYSSDVIDLDAGGGDASASSSLCPSPLLIAGKEFDPTLEYPPGLVVDHHNAAGHEDDLNGESFGGKEYVPAAVAVTDLPGNASNMSEVVCLHVVNTTGFWERYRENGGTAEPGCACSAPGARSTPIRFWPGIPFALLLGGLSVRRRLRRRAR